MYHGSRKNVRLVCMSASY